jgi:dTDP-glucose pyrophosphorylase
LNDWNKTLVSPSDTLENAINVINESNYRIALVVDHEKKLCGTITDGDVRRALLKHIEMESSVLSVMNPNPVVANNKVNEELLLQMMNSNDILHLPILDNEKCIQGLETLQNLIRGMKRDNPVFLMAGGFGTRLKSLTKDTPKPLLKVGNRPILEIILLQFIDAGFHNFYISIHYKHEMIREHFDNGSKWGVSIKYIHESTPLGTAGALGLLPIRSKGLPILMMNGDLITDLNIEDLLNFHNEQGGLATMCVREYKFQVPYGVVSIKNQRIKKITEKPEHKFFVNAGIYVIERKILDSISGESYLDLPNLIESQLANGDQINAFPIHESWSDIGQIDEYESVNNKHIDDKRNE